MVAVVDNVAGGTEVSVETETPLVFCDDPCCTCFTVELAVDGGLSAGGSLAEHEGEDAAGLAWADSCLGEDLGGEDPESGGWGGDAFTIRGSQGIPPTGLLVEPVTSLSLPGDDSGRVVDTGDFADGVTSGEFESFSCSRGATSSFFGCTVSSLLFFLRMYSWRLTRRGGFGPSKGWPPVPISIPESGVEITSSSTLSSASSPCSSSSDIPSMLQVSTSMSSSCEAGAADSAMAAEVSGLLGGDGGFGSVECFSLDCDSLEGDCLFGAATVGRVLEAGCTVGDDDGG